MERGAKVALIERHLLGGASLWTGSVPSKAIIRTARLYAEMRTAEKFGAAVPGGIQENFAATMARMRRLRIRISEYHSAERLRISGVDLYFCAARFAGRSAVSLAEAERALRQGADRHRRAAAAHPHPGTGGGRLSHQRRRVRSDAMPAAPARHRRRPVGMRAGTGVLSARSPRRHRPERPEIPAQGRARCRPDTFGSAGARRCRDSSRTPPWLRCARRAPEKSSSISHLPTTGARSRSTTYWPAWAAPRISKDWSWSGPESLAQAHRVSGSMTSCGPPIGGSMPPGTSVSPINSPIRRKPPRGSPCPTPSTAAASE